MTLIKNRARVLEEMGLGPEWLLRGQSADKAKHEEIIPDEMPDTPAISVAPDMPVLAAVLDEPAPDTLRTLSGLKTSVNQDFPSWEAFTETIRNCRQCDLCETRTNTVPGVGDIHAEWLFIGEGPGFHEDQQGEPFVGRSGKLLDNMMAALGIKRGSNAYIANIVKCRASDERKKDRPPTEEESATCMLYLQWQIAQIKPKVIVALGKTAAVGLLNTDRDITMSAMRNKVHLFSVGGKEIPLIATYHPAYLLRTPMAKKQAWADLCLAIETVEKQRK